VAAGFEGALVHRAPVVFHQVGREGDGAGLLRRDDIDDVALKVFDEPDQGARARVQFLHCAALCRAHPLDHAVVGAIAVELGPALGVEALFGEGILGVEDGHLGPRLVVLAVHGDLRRALVGPGRALERIRRGHDDHMPALGHGLDLVAQQLGLGAGVPGVRNALVRDLLAVARDGVPLEADARGDDAGVVVEAVAARRLDAFRHRVDADGRVLDHVDAIATQAVVAEGQRFAACARRSAPRCS
jgi:hypothetical protein